MGSPQGSLVPPLDRTFGKYELVAKLATGGMAEIFLARRGGEGASDDLVVIKRVLPHLAEDERFIAMFRDEARIASRLEHPNVCKVFELGRVGDTYFISMEYLHGVPLSRLLLRAARVSDPLDLRLIAGVIHQCCLGLHHAHELCSLDGRPLDVVHRDVSPPNIFVTESGVVKLLDFGVAKARGASQKTRTGTVKGKNSYMSPEQILGKTVDRRSDVFALGIVMWESMTASRLFSRDTDFLTFQAITEAEIPDVRERRPDAPEELCRVLYKSLAAECEDRYADCHEFGEALVAAMEGQGGLAGEEELAAFIREEFERELESKRKLFEEAVESEVVDEEGYEALWFSAESETQDALLARAEAADKKSAGGAEAEEAEEEQEEEEEESVPMQRIGAGVGTLPTPARGAPLFGAQRRRPLLWAAGGAAAALAVVLLVVFVFGGSSGGERAAAPAPATAAKKTSEPGAKSGSAAKRGAGAAAAKANGAQEKGAEAGREKASTGDADQADENEDASKEAATGDEGAKGEGAGQATGAEGAGKEAGKDASEGAGDRAAEKKLRPGYFSIDSKPWARIFVDGRELGVTPLFKKKLPAGRHHVKAVSATGETKRFSIKVKPRKTAMRRLKWP